MHFSPSHAKKPKEWDAQVCNKPLLKKLGDLVWKAPVNRGSVECANVGLNIEPEFETKAGDKSSSWISFLMLSLDGLFPVTFWYENQSVMHPLQPRVFHREHVQSLISSINQLHPFKLNIAISEKCHVSIGRD